MSEQPESARTTLKFLRIEDRGEPVAVFEDPQRIGPDPEFALDERWLRHRIEIRDLHDRDASVEREALAAMMKHEPAPEQPQRPNDMRNPAAIAAERIMTEVFPRVGEWNERCREKVRRIILGQSAEHIRREMPEPPA